jgi:hypothetical protein
MTRLSGRRLVQGFAGQAGRAGLEHLPQIHRVASFPPPRRLGLVVRKRANALILSPFVFIRRNHPG